LNIEYFLSVNEVQGAGKPRCRKCVSHGWQGSPGIMQSTEVVFLKTINFSGTPRLGKI